MRLTVFLIVFLIFVSLPVYAKDVNLLFRAYSSPESFTVNKGTSVDLPVVVVNQDKVSMTCSISSSLGLQSFSLNGGDPKILYFKYDAPNKIKNLNILSVTFTTDCKTAAAPYTCTTTEFPFFTTCYYVSSPFIHHVTVNYALSVQDQQNQALLEEYKKGISYKITDIDKKNQKLNELILKTPNPILPNNAKNENSQNQNQINQLSGTFQTVVKSLEDESYDFGSKVSLHSDLNQITTANSKIDELTTSINTNLEKYNTITQTLNELLKETKGKVSKLNYKFNNDLISQLNDIGTTTNSKITNYQFSDLDDADNIIKTYSKEKDNLLTQMQNNVNDFSNRGIPSIIKQLELFCSDFQLCDTKNKLKSLNLETTKNFDDLCKSFDGLSSEITKFNDKETIRYQDELKELNKKNQEIKNKNEVIKKDIGTVQKRNDIQENLNLKLSTIEKEITASIKRLNSYGKTTDLSKYSNLAKNFNTLNLDQKLNKTKELEEASNEVKIKIDESLNEEKGFVSFFKKVFYTVFGTKQEIEKLKLEEKEDLPKLLAEIPNTISPARIAFIDDESAKFLREICTISDKAISDLKVSSLNIKISEKESTIKTEAKEAEKSCFDENNQRTTNCCDGDEYKSKTELYPVIFIHGHSFEIERGDIQTSLSTFDQMSKYFSQNGYVEESLLYPESAEKLAKGIWAFCDKPVVIRLTYYDGLVSGTTHNYKSSIADYSPVLKKEIENILQATNKDKVIIVAHSMGGILSRYYILKDMGKDKVHKLITIGSPHYGVRDGASFLSNLPFAAMESKQMKPGSDFLRMLNEPSDSLVPTYTITGNSQKCSLGTKDCDGVLYVESGRLKLENSHITFTGSQYEHSKIVNQPEVSKQVLDYIKT